MKITRAGSLPSTSAPADWFTGPVRFDPLVPVPEGPRRSTANLVTFEPGARTNWHTHPCGQIIIVTAGAGRCADEGGPVEDLRPGDVVVFDPGVRHWHGAGPDTAMSHIAVQEVDDTGSQVDWQEPVSDADYGA